MRRKILGSLLVTVLLATGFPVEAQQPGKVYRIGYVTAASEIRKDVEETFRNKLRELGYVEGKNLAIEWRFSKGRLDLLPNLASELVGLKLDCIVASGIAPTRAVKQASTTVPIVMANADDDPVRQALVASLARPGGNVTGFTNIGSDLAGKRLEILKETVPKATRVAILWDPKGPGGAGHAREAKLTAPVLGAELQPVEVRSPEDLDNAFRVTVQGRAEALTVVTTGLMNSQRTKILNLAVKTRLPAIYSSSGWVLDGGLMGYVDDARDRARGVATYVDKILKGTKAADLPVQRPMKFEFIVNLKSAKQIGLTIPPNVLVRADRVIR
jgi:putative ABC transport system substrate-binding protein